LNTNETYTSESYLTSKTEQWACCITPFATLPINNLFSPVLPLVPMTDDDLHYIRNAATTSNLLN